jgi:hypothetical protein
MTEVMSKNFRTLMFGNYTQTKNTQERLKHITQLKLVAQCTYKITSYTQKAYAYSFALFYAFLVYAYPTNQLVAPLSPDPQKCGKYYVDFDGKAYQFISCVPSEAAPNAPNTLPPSHFPQTNRMHSNMPLMYYNAPPTQYDPKFNRKSISINNEIGIHDKSGGSKNKLVSTQNIYESNKDTKELGRPNNTQQRKDQEKAAMEMDANKTLKSMKSSKSLTEKQFNLAGEPDSFAIPSVKEDASNTAQPQEVFSPLPQKTRQPSVNRETVQFIGDSGRPAQIERYIPRVVKADQFFNQQPSNNWLNPEETVPRPSSQQQFNLHQTIQQNLAERRNMGQAVQNPGPIKLAPTYRPLSPDESVSFGKHLASQQNSPFISNIEYPIVMKVSNQRPISLEQEASLIQGAEQQQATPASSINLSQKLRLKQSKEQPPQSQLQFQQYQNGPVSYYKPEPVVMKYINARPVPLEQVQPASSTQKFQMLSPLSMEQHNQQQQERIYFSPIPGKYPLHHVPSVMDDQPINLERPRANQEKTPIEAPKSDSLVRYARRFEPSVLTPKKLARRNNPENLDHNTAFFPTQEEIIDKYQQIPKTVDPPQMVVNPHLINEPIEPIYESPNLTPNEAFFKISPWYRHAMLVELEEIAKINDINKLGQAQGNIPDEAKQTARKSLGILDHFHGTLHSAANVLLNDGYHGAENQNTNSIVNNITIKKRFESEMPPEGAVTQY